MAVTYGFYNGRDRVYDARDFSQIFDGIILDGVFMSLGNTLFTKAFRGMTVIVGSGRAWFNGTWTNNTSDLEITLDESFIDTKRIDRIVLEVNELSRKNSIMVLKGDGEGIPEYINNDTIHQYPLATIYVNPGVSEITESDIFIEVGTYKTPWITGILEHVSMDELLGDWRGDLDRFMADKNVQLQNWVDKAENDYDQWLAAHDRYYEGWVTNEQENFLAWVDQMKGSLNVDSAGNLQNQIDRNLKRSMGYDEVTITFEGNQIIKQYSNNDKEKITFNKNSITNESLFQNVKTTITTTFEGNRIIKRKTGGV